MVVAIPALAQQPPNPQKVDPLIEEVGRLLSPDGIRERQLQAIKALADAYTAEKEARIAEKEWWSLYVKGLNNKPK